METVKRKNSLEYFMSGNARELSMLAIIGVVCILVQIRTQGRFFSSQNISDLFRETAILMMVSTGMTFVMLTGGIDLSVGAIMGLCGMIGALTLRDNRDIPLPLLFLLVLAVGCVCGMFNGILVAKIRIFPIIATLAAQDIFRGVTYLFSKGAWVGQGDMTPQFLAISTNSFLGINNLVWFAILIIALGYLTLGYNRIGRNMYAVGSNESSARVSGVKVERTKFLAYTINGMISGVAGLLWICKFGNAQGDSGSGFELNVIASCVLGGVAVTGGVGKVPGVVLGAMLFGILNNILPLIQVSAFWQQAIRGAVILIAVVFNALMHRRSSRNALKRRA